MRITKPTMMVFCLLLLAMVPVAAEDLDCAEGYRWFDHEHLANDPVCVPEDPQRVVALDLAALELLFYADEIEAVGTASWITDEMAAMLPALKDKIDDVPDVGYPANLESVLEADPDVILAYSAQDDIIDVEQASEIAPVVTTTLAVDDWERTTQFWASALGIEPLFEELRENYDARIRALREALPMDPAKQAVSLVTANTYGVNIWLADSPQGKILADVGFARPEPQQLAGEAAVEEYGTRQYAVISDEALDLADGDIIYLFNYATSDPETAAEEEAAVAEFRDRPLWQQLEGVQNDQVHRVGNHWYRAGTYLLANKVIDDLFTTLTDTTPSDVPPAPLKPEDVTGSE